MTDRAKTSKDKTAASVSDELAQAHKELTILKDSLYDKLPSLVAAAREETDFGYRIADSILDKLLDISKTFIGIGVPGIVTIYAVRPEAFNSESLVKGLILMISASIGLFVGVFVYGANHYSKYLTSSTKRLEVIDKLTLYALQADERRVDQFNEKYSRVIDAERDAANQP